MFQRYLNQMLKIFLEEIVELRGLDPGLELVTPTNQTLTTRPFINNLRSAGYSLTRSSIWG